MDLWLFTFHVQLYMMNQRFSTTLRILSLTTVRGLMHVLFHGYNVKQSSLESTNNLKTILSMNKVLPVSTSVYFPSYRWHRSVSNKIMTRYQILMNGCKKKLAVEGMYLHWEPPGLTPQKIGSLFFLKTNPSNIQYCLWYWLINKKNSVSKLFIWNNIKR